MATSNTDRVSTSWMSTFATALWEKIKDTFVNISDTQTITGKKTFNADPIVKNTDTSQPSKVILVKSNGTDNENIQLRYDTSGNRGLYDNYNKDWIVKCGTDNVPTLNGIANKANEDKDGNQIDTTYLKKNAEIVGATKCKVTYDKNGLITAGSNLMASDLPDHTHKYSDIQRITTFSGRGSSSYYCKLCTITIIGEFVNYPIEIELVERGRETVSRLQVLFQSTGILDPTLTSFGVIGSHNLIYIKKTETSKWVIWVRKNENYAEIDVMGVKFHPDKFSIEWNMENDDLPDNTTRASFVGSVEKAKTAENSTKWGGKSLVVGPMPEAASMSADTIYISE